MGGACSTHVNYEKCVQGLVENPEGKRDHLGYLDVDGRIILKWALNKYHVELW
jgi:hypothetical protein